MILTVHSKVSDFRVDFSPVLKSDVTLEKLRGILRIDEDVRGVVVLKQRGVRAEKNECTYYRIDDRLIRGVFASLKREGSYTEAQVEDIQTFLFSIALTATHCRETLIYTNQEEFSKVLVRHTADTTTWLKSFRVPADEKTYCLAKHVLKSTTTLTVKDYKLLEGCPVVLETGGSTSSRSDDTLVSVR